MIRKDSLVRSLVALIFAVAVAACGCARLGNFAKSEAAVSGEPAAPSAPAAAGDVALASFETACAGGCAHPEGYLAQGPVFSTADGVGSPAAAVTRLRQLTAEKERLAAENREVKQRLGQLQDELIKARQSLLATQQECQAARNELAATRTQLEECRRLMEKTLEQFQVAEKEHLGALDGAIDSIRTVVDRQRKEEHPATENANSRKRGTIVSG